MVENRRKKNKMKITKKTDMNELLMAKPELAGLLFQVGMGCAGCPMSMGETLEQGCKVHGMTDKEIDKLIEMLNKNGEKKKKKAGGKKK
jgi:hybrid cluster-associated redox disulfide protein